MVTHWIGLRQEAPPEKHDDGRLGFEAWGGALGLQDGMLIQLVKVQLPQLISLSAAPNTQANAIKYAVQCAP